MIFLALLLRISCFGFTYYPQLDDYIQYYNYVQSTDYVQLMLREGLLCSRPLAALTDIYVWMQLPLYLSVVLISLLYAASAVIYSRLFAKYFKTGIFFAIFYSLLPLGYEGTYWLSASARVVTGLFFTSLTLYLFDRLCETRRTRLLPVFLLAALMSYGYYEQILMLSVALVGMLAMLRLRRGERYPFIFLTIELPLLCYFLFTSRFSSEGSALGSRMSIVLPNTRYYFDTFLPDLLGQLRDAFIVGAGATLLRGFVRGITIIFTERVLAALLIPLVSVPIYLLARYAPSSDARSEKPLTTVIFAVLAMLAPIAPFFFIANPWFSLRNTVASYVGLALLGDFICRRLAALIKNARVGSIVTASVATLCTAVFLTAGVSELHDYKATYEKDEVIVDTILAAVEEQGLRGEIGIFALNPTMIDEQNYIFHDHIVGVSNSAWSLYGALAHRIGTAPDFSVCPLTTEGSYFRVHWNWDEKELSRFDYLFRYDNETDSLVKLTLEVGNHEYLIYDPDGSLYARVWDENEPYGYIELYS